MRRSVCVYIMKDNLLEVQLLVKKLLWSFVVFVVVLLRVLFVTKSSFVSGEKKSHFWGERMRQEKVTCFLLVLVSVLSSC